MITLGQFALVACVVIGVVALSILAWQAGKATDELRDEAEDEDLWFWKHGMERKDGDEGPRYRR